MKPFLKWAGNKYRIIDQIRRHLPEGKRLIEPFAGSAAVFLNTNYPRYILGDINPDLINLYEHVKTRQEKFIRYCHKFFIPENNSADCYYQFRDEFNNTTDLQKKAALFIYLNRHGYNGLCRYNRSGAYNVPFGHYRRPYFPLNEMRDFYLKSDHMDLHHEDFSTLLMRAVPGDVVYCDPPYFPISSTAKFTQYSRGGFDTNHQILLASIAETLVEKGVSVLISNHAVPEARRLYARAKLVSFSVRRSISRNGQNRGNVREILALYIPQKAKIKSKKTLEKA